MLFICFSQMPLRMGEALIEQEEVVCTSCYFKLPKTGFHLHEDNIISQIFWVGFIFIRLLHFYFLTKEAASSG